MEGLWGAMIGGFLAIAASVLSQIMENRRRREERQEEREYSRKNEKLQHFERLLMRAISFSDPDRIGGPVLAEYGNTVVELQLYLNRSDPLQGKLNNHLNLLGTMALPRYLATGEGRGDVLIHHAGLIDVGGAILRSRGFVL